MDRMSEYLINSNDRSILQLCPLSFKPKVPQPRNIVTVIILNIQCDVTDIIKMHAFDGVFWDFGLLACVRGWDDGDGCCCRKIRCNGKVNILSVDKPSIVSGRTSDGFTYTLTVWGEERSGGARMRIDLSLTTPVKLALGQKLRSLNTGAEARDENDHFGICVAFEYLELAISTY